MWATRGVLIRYRMPVKVYTLLALPCSAAGSLVQYYLPTSKTETMCVKVMLFCSFPAKCINPPGAYETLGAFLPTVENRVCQIDLVP